MRGRGWCECLGWRVGGLSSDKGKALGAGCGRCLWLVWSSGFNRVVSILAANLSFGVGSENEIYVLPSSAQDGPNCDLPAPWRHLRAVQGCCISLPNSLTSCPALRHQSSFEHVPFQLISSFPSIALCGGRFMFQVKWAPNLAVFASAFCPIPPKLQH